MVPGGENISSGAISKKRLKSQSTDFTEFLLTFKASQEAAGLARPPLRVSSRSAGRVKVYFPFAAGWFDLLHLCFLLNHRPQQRQ